MNVHSLAFYRHPQSAYEHPNCGEAQGRYFVNYLRAVVRAHSIVWPDWELRIHHDEKAREFPYFKALELMQDAGILTLVPCGEARTLCGAMLWRLKPIFDPDVRYVICRDVDSLPQPRDRQMVEEFIASGAILHAILDSLSHAGPLMGGMLGVDAVRFRGRTGHASLESLLAAGEPLGIDYNLHGADQRFLNGVVYPYLAPATYIHAKRNLGYVAQVTNQVAPRVDPLDYVAHVGGAFDVERAMEIMAKTKHRSCVTIAQCERDAGLQENGLP